MVFLEISRGCCLSTKLDRQAQDGEVLALRPSGEVVMKKLDTARCGSEGFCRSVWVRFWVRFWGCLAVFEFLGSVL